MKSMLLAFVCGSVFLVSCARQVPEDTVPKGDELPTLSVTLWGGRVELFMEHPPLVLGQPAAFAVHLTDLSSFRPLAEGKAILELEGAGRTLRRESLPTTRPGIYRINVTPDRAGRFRGTLRVEGPGLQDRLDLGELTVFSAVKEALEAGSGAEPADAVSYLKEQQWSADFATAVAGLREMARSIRVPASVQPRADGEGAVVAPVSGRLITAVRLPLPGDQVQRGQVIAGILPLTASPQDPAGLRLELAQAETDFGQARRQRGRLEALLAAQAIPARRLEEVIADETRARARIAAARARLDQYERSRIPASGTGSVPEGTFEVEAPLAGLVTKLSAVPGNVVDAGQEILKIVAVDRVWVVAEVPESESAVLARLRSAELELPGTLPAAQLASRRAVVSNIGKMVHPDSRRIPVTLDADNRDGQLRIGQSLFVRFGVGETADALAVPGSSLVEDGGQTVVFVQSAGESFVKRTVKTGLSSDGYVQIFEGLRLGERVVSRGAYAIRLAALSTQIPAHGHVH